MQATRPVPNPIVVQLDHELLSRLPQSLEKQVSIGLFVEDGTPTIAAAVCLAVSVPEGVPWLRVRRFTTGSDEVTEHALEPTEDRLVAGPLPHAVEELALELSRSAPIAKVDGGLGAGLFKEVLVNAIGHRSYDPARCAEHTVVDVFSDRLIVRSPGAVHPAAKLTPGRGPRGRRSQNPHLMGLLGMLGLAHQQGRGWTAVRKLAPILGYEATMVSTGGQVTVELVVDPELVIDAAQSARQERRLRIPRDGLDRRIVDLLRTTGTRSAREMEDLLGVPNSTVRAALRRLEDRAVVRRTRATIRSRHQRYALVD